MKEGLKANFTGECTEVGMYLAISRQADREGYPEVTEAFKLPNRIKKPTSFLEMGFCHTMEIAAAGQTLTHFVQPMHFS